MFKDQKDRFYIYYVYLYYTHTCTFFLQQLVILNLGSKEAGLFHGDMPKNEQGQSEVSHLEKTYAMMCKVEISLPSLKIQWKGLQMKTAK